ncbi:MAG: 5-oxoprolinase [Chloroflexi bacterium]|nr:5-oxoprolinase [Chloroflexota bacterium]|tara:strand:+ start:4877 stop:6601 length:1725 start_codon:yes stop_codon:yes gene_type:complete
MDNEINPIRFEVIKNALIQATEEMAITLRRSAYSTNVKTRQDFSCAFFDNKLRCISQAFTQPIHLGSFVKHVPEIIIKYDPENINQGDMILSNDPYGGGVHLNDITLISPVYHSKILLGYVACLAHHVDVGGGAPASVGSFQEIFQEGVIIPRVKIVENGKIVNDIFNLLLAQIRSKHETSGDLRAQIGSNLTGSKRIVEIVQKYGLNEFFKYIDEIIEYTDRRTKKEVMKLPKGNYFAEGFIDNDGFTDKKVNLKINIKIDDNGVFFNTDGSDLQRRAPVNSTYAQTFSACAYALRTLMDRDLPVNDGFYRYVNVHAPEGTVTNCKHPSPVVGGWETHVRLNDLIYLALSRSFPDIVCAGTKSMQCHSGFGGINFQTGEYYCFLETLAGGYGARYNSDGPDAVQAHGQNTENAPIEETEINYPVQITRYELVPNSEGPGKFRGGLGLRRDYMFTGETTFTILADRDKEGPHGLFGGEKGSLSIYTLQRYNQKTRINLSSKITLQLEFGDTISYMTSGGGGYGNPFKRNPQKVLEDYLQGKISYERARDKYGVEIDINKKKINHIKTKILRKNI